MRLRHLLSLSMLLPLLATAGDGGYLVQMQPEQLKVYVDSFNESLPKEELQQRVLTRVRMHEIEPQSGFARDSGELDLNVVVDGTLFTEASAAPFLVSVHIGTRVERYGFVATETVCRKFGTSRKRSVLEMVDYCVDQVIQRYREANKPH